jgi:hypothetical protein
MTDAGWSLQAAIVTALKADAALKVAMEIASGDATVLDYVPENQAMPYVEYEDGESREWDAGEGPGGTMEYGGEHTFRLYCWSSYEGKKQAKAMIRAIDLRLRDATNLDLSGGGHGMINIRKRWSYVLRDPDQQAYYGVIEFRAVTEELPGD